MGFHGYNYFNRFVKRDAEAEPEAEADPQVFYRTYGYYPSWYTHQQSAYTTPYTRYSTYTHGYPTTYTTPFHGYNYFNRFVKREAEAEPEADAEADPQVFYRTYGYYPSWYTHQQSAYTTPYTRY